MAQNQAKPVYAYTQHESTIRVLETMCNISIVRLKQDRNRDPVEDVLSQLPDVQQAVLYAVLPIDKAVELRQKAPWLKLRLLQLDGAIIEKLTGKPYDPKAEYPSNVIQQALKVIEVRSGTVRHMTLRDMIEEINKKGCKKIGIFNDTMREGFKLALQRERIGVDIELVKTCGGDSNCAEVNPLGYKSGYRVSFPGTAGRLTPEQMADLIVRGEARIYYVEIVAEETPLCP